MKRLLACAVTSLVVMTGSATASASAGPTAKQLHHGTVSMSKVKLVLHYDVKPTGNPLLDKALLTFGDSIRANYVDTAGLDPHFHYPAKFNVADNLLRLRNKYTYWIARHQAFRGSERWFDVTGARLDSVGTVRVANFLVCRDYRKVRAYNTRTGKPVAFPILGTGIVVDRVAMILRPGHSWKLVSTTIERDATAADCR